MLERHPNSCDPTDRRGHCPLHHQGTRRGSPLAWGRRPLRELKSTSSVSRKHRKRAEMKTPIKSPVATMLLQTPLLNQNVRWVRLLQYPIGQWVEWNSLPHETDSKTTEALNAKDKNPIGASKHHGPSKSTVFGCRGSQ